MKRFVNWTALAALVLALPAGCSKNETPEKPASAPVITMVGADINDVHEIENGMTVKVNVKAEAGIQAFGIKIESPVLTDEFLGTVQLAKEMDLVNPATPAMAGALGGLGFPVGKAVSGKTDLTFDISQLIPLIAAIYDKTSDHNFTLTVADASSREVVGTLKFHLTGSSAATYNKDADLWANTASVKVKLGDTPSDPALEYKKSTDAEWQKVGLALNSDGSYTGSIAPIWKDEADHASGVKLHSLDGKTGVFAGCTYEFRVVNGGEPVEGTSGSFTTAAGDAIPNGDMSGWSKKIWIDSSEKGWPITYPNAEGQDFWDSGNNSFLEQYETDGTPKFYTPLCSGSEGTAHLMPQMVLGSIFAPGNMYTGFFDYAGFSGTAKFGQPYVWTARPRALKLRYKATVGVIDQLGYNDPDADSYKDQQDRSCIFAAVVNWSAQHGVTSGMSAPTGMWNPADGAAQAEGPILGYGQEIITASTDGWVELTIPIVWYDKDAVNPSSSAFSLVISCATSLRGDYLTGCSKNEMYVDDFQWVY